MRIALIGCIKKKSDTPCEARDMYISPLFKGCYKLAKKMGAERIYILSAKYGLIDEQQIIKPYNETLNDKSEYKKKDMGLQYLPIISKKGGKFRER